MDSIGNIRVRDYIIKSIREGILSGVFLPGTRLAQEELAESLGVSRIPVREALQILEEQGLVKRLPSRHMVVAEITALQFRQIFQSIGMLQYQFSGFILDGEDRGSFLREAAAWKGHETGFHRLVSRWLDNSCLSRQFDSLLDIYVEYACGLAGIPGESSADILAQVKAALLGDRTEEYYRLLQGYYEILEKKVLAERGRNLCRD